MRTKLRLGIDELTRASIEDEELTQVPEADLAGFRGLGVLGLEV